MTLLLDSPCKAGARSTTAFWSEKIITQYLVKRNFKISGHPILGSLSYVTYFPVGRYGSTNMSSTSQLDHPPDHNSSNKCLTHKQPSHGQLKSSYRRPSFVIPYATSPLKNTSNLTIRQLTSFCTKQKSPCTVSRLTKSFGLCFNNLEETICAKDSKFDKNQN